MRLPRTFSNINPNVDFYKRNCFLFKFLWNLSMFSKFLIFGLWQDDIIQILNWKTLDKSKITIKVRVYIIWAKKKLFRMQAKDFPMFSRTSGNVYKNVNSSWNWEIYLFTIFFFLYYKKQRVHENSPEEWWELAKP